MQEDLAQALVDFNKEAVLGAITKRLKDGDAPIQLIRELQDGMGRIGQKFETGDFFLSELLMSADLFSKAIKSHADPRAQIAGNSHGYHRYDRCRHAQGRYPRYR
jgi:methanogenic corrinoid protein MtbC1